MSQIVTKTIDFLPNFYYGKSFPDKEIFELFYLIVCKFKIPL
jgi:hypothetical protein